MLLIPLQVNYFHFVAEEIRAGLASLGMRSLDELTGRSDLLRQRDHTLSKTNGLDLSFISRFVGPCQKYSDRIEAKVGNPLAPQAYRAFSPVRQDPFLYWKAQEDFDLRERPAFTTSCIRSRMGMI